MAAPSTTTPGTGPAPTNSTPSGAARRGLTRSKYGCTLATGGPFPRRTVSMSGRMGDLPWTRTILPSPMERFTTGTCLPDDGRPGHFAPERTPTWVGVLSGFCFARTGDGAVDRTADGHGKGLGADEGEC